jgi:DNA repair exonuclease SbcCD ATPase subunit
MSAEIEVEDAVAGLYRLPLGEFVAGRDRLARQLRAAGDREAARRVAALRRPSISAWAANQLARAAPHAMAELLEVGAALAQAQEDALAGQAGAARRMRTSSAQLRAAISRLTQRAETLLTRAGHGASDATLARLAATLRAAATADEATRAALAEGRLAGDLDPAGFGLLVEEAAPAETAPAEAAPAEEVAPAPPAPGGADSAVARREQARRAAQRALERTGRAAEQARAALEQARAMAAGQEQAALAARQRAQELAEAAEELAERAAAAAATAEQARQRAEAAERDAEALADRARLAEDAARAAEDAHAAATAALEELTGP